MSDAPVSQDFPDTPAARSPFNTSRPAAPMWIAQGVTYPRTLDGQDAADPALLFGELSQESFHCRHGACAGPTP